MSTPESNPESTLTRLPWATQCRSRPLPYDRVDFILQTGTLDLASVQCSTLRILSLRISLIAEAHIGAMTLLVILPIWFGYIVRLS
jgi:hypothetical protein